MAKAGIRIIAPPRNYRPTSRQRIRDVVREAFAEAYGKGDSPDSHTTGLDGGAPLSKSQYAAQLAEMNLSRLLIDVPDDRHWMAGGIIY